MRIWLFIPYLLGLAAVVQGGLNRRVADSGGLPWAVILNSVVVMAGAVVYFLLARSRTGGVLEGGGFSAVARSPWLVASVLGAGACGLCFVVGIPFAIPRLGALRVFLGIIAAQILGSLLWDAAIESRPLTLIRIGGAAVTFVGVWIASL